MSIWVHSFDFISFAIITNTKTERLINSINQLIDLGKEY
jgi:hypothetical protein